MILTSNTATAPARLDDARTLRDFLDEHAPALSGAVEDDELLAYLDRGDAPESAPREALEAVEALCWGARTPCPTCGRPSYPDELQPTLVVEDGPNGEDRVLWSGVVCSDGCRAHALRDAGVEA